MSPLSRWIIGAHLFLGGWVFFAYICWLAIDSPAQNKYSEWWHRLRLALAGFLLMVLMYYSLTLMGNTHLIPRHHETALYRHLLSSLLLL